MEVFIKEQRREWIKEQLSAITNKKKIPRKDFESLVGVISFCSQVIVCLRAPLRYFYEKQTIFRKPEMIRYKNITLSRRDKFVAKWLLMYLHEWKGVAPIASTIWQSPDLSIWTDAGTASTDAKGHRWGMGAWVEGTGEYISEPWPQELLNEAVSIKSGNLSVPFLEVFIILVAVLTFAPIGCRILVKSDSVPAVNIVNKRWSKENDRINNYLGKFDLECSKKNISVQVKQVARTTNKIPHFLAAGRENHPAQKNQLTVKKKAFHLTTLY
jgi:hypothetical protein